MEIIKKTFLIIFLFVSFVFAEEVNEFRVIIDPGHGGKDGGAACNGLKEKDVTLEVALLLQKIILEKECGIKPLLTRSEDKFVTLEDRVIFANQSEGHLFLSLHLNASQSKKDNGVEVYYNALPSDELAKDVAKRENTFAQEKNNDEEETSTLFILWDLVQNEFLKESANFACLLQNSIDTMFNKSEDKKFSIRNRGVKQATFLVLKGVRMPAVLLEMGFVSNESDSKNFKQKEFKEKYAESIFDAIMSYKLENEKKFKNKDNK
jgi:N-acetylmuramoyl-L-alanine amidase